MNSDYDVICIGAGPAGEALTAQLKGSGVSLAVVERALVGGECPYWGCIPSKTLLRSAETIVEAGRARELAASRVDWTVDFDRVARRVQWMTRSLDDTGAARSLEQNGATLYRGEARLRGARAVEVGNHRLNAKRAVVIATGTDPATPNIPGFADVSHWTNREAVQAKHLPRSLAIIGSGAAGVELAQAFARLGTRVQMVEAADRIVSLEEPEAGQYLAERFQVEGIGVTVSARITRVERGGQGVRILLDKDGPLEAETLLVATGRRANLQGFDLQGAGLSLTQRGFVQVDQQTLRAADGIFAIGDVNGIGGFTHLSHYHGTLVGRALKGQAARADHSAVPRVTFTDPEIASVGLSEKQARENGIRVVIATANVGETARGYIHGEPGGLIKLIADASDKILVGATLVSPRAGEMLSTLSLAIKTRMPLDVLDDLIYPFPTFARVLQGVFEELRSKVRQPAPVSA